MDYHPRNTLTKLIDDDLLHSAFRQLNIGAQVHEWNHLEFSFDVYLTEYFTKFGRAVTKNHIAYPEPLNAQFHTLADTLIHDFCRQTFPGIGFTIGEFDGKTLFYALRKVYRSRKFKPHRR
jgi:hypothetical protein